MSEVKTGTKKPSGRRPAGSGAKQHILAAASELFASQGYDRTSLRQIASSAKVDPSLILHYFGSKKRLHVASLLPLMEGPKQLPTTLQGDIDNVGERLARMLVGLMQDTSARTLLLSLFRSISSDGESAEALQQFVQLTVMDTVEPYLPGPDKKLQANILGSQIIGIFIARYIIKIEPLATIDDRQLIAYLAPRLQSHFTAPVTP